MTFLDEPNLRSVATALWDGTPLGRASVMVGAGFSRNAIPIHANLPSSKPFPGWGELTESMARELYASPSDTVLLQRALLSASSTSGALRIADEYQAWKGRGKLDAMLKRAIPDEHFIPGPLHNLLFKLPWSDILTTNFDTLLERAAANEMDRHYSVVRSQEDIPGSIKPRVVKLHGSFPDTKPFIITEDDFRTYDQTNPVMVNLVQQCFVENTCCLIGFSGDDPNFLRWTGWVRDILGPTHMEPIYLVGLLNHTPARRALLERRYVRSIDLAPLFPETEWPDADARHAAATDWFLRALLHLKPPEFHNWPDRTDVAEASPLFENSPALPEQEQNSLMSEYSHPANIELPGDTVPRVTDDAFVDLAPEEQASEAQALLTAISKRSEGPPLNRRVGFIIDIWSHNRQRYPGWLVLPWPNRNHLEEMTLPWVEAITTAVFGVEKTIAVRWLYELQWRLDKGLTVWPEKLISAVERLLVAQHLEDLTADQQQAGMVRALAVQLLRSYREGGRHHDFERWLDLTRPLVLGDPDHEAFMTHQYALSLLEEWQIDKAENVLSSWNVDGLDPIWRVRKAALLGELGSSSAIHEAVRALKDVQQIGRRDDLAARTREEAALWLTAVLTPTRSPERRKLDVRRHELRRKGFTSASVAEQLSSRVAGSSAGFTGPPARSTRNDPTAVEAAVIVRRYVEDTGSLLRRPGVVAEGALVAGAVPWLAWASPVAAMRLSVRNRANDSNTSLLAPSRLAQVPSEAIQIVFDGLREAIKSLGNQLRRFSRERQYGQSLGGTDEYTPAERVNWLLKSALAHLEDISPILDETRLQEAVRLCFALRASWKAGQWQTWERIETTVSALLTQCADQTIIDLLPEILEQPIVGLDNKIENPATSYDVVAQSCIRLLTESLKHDVGASLRIGELFGSLSRPIDLSTKSRIIMRLTAAWHWGLLDTEMERSLSEWVNVLMASARTDGVKATRRYFLSPEDLLLVPTIQEKNIRRQMIQAISISEWRPQVSRNADGRPRSIRSTGPDDPIVLASALTSEPWVKKGWQLSADEWSREETMAMLKNAEDWMQIEGIDLLQQRAGDAAGIHDIRAKSIVEFCRKVVLPKSDDNELVEKAVALLNEIQKYGLATLSAVGLFVSGETNFSADAAAADMRKAASSLHSSTSFAFLIGLLAWLSVANDGDLRPPPDDLLQEVAIAVRSRRAPDLTWAIQIADIILKQYSDTVGHSFRRDISVGLQYLAFETDVRSPTLNVVQQQGTLEEIRQSSIALAATLQNFPEGGEVALAWRERQKFETVRRIKAEYDRLTTSASDIAPSSSEVQ